ncbi:MAG: hypothetical protein V4714_08005 [Bacteroidota bacterium]
MGKYFLLLGLHILLLLATSCKKDPHQETVNALDGLWTVDKTEYTDQKTDSIPLPQTGVFSFSACKIGQSGAAGPQCDGYYQLGNQPQVTYKFDAFDGPSPLIGQISWSIPPKNVYYSLETVWNITKRTDKEMAIEGYIGFNHLVNPQGNSPFVRVRIHLHR